MLSSARPGARYEDYEGYVKTLKEMKILPKNMRVLMMPMHLKQGENCGLSSIPENWMMRRQ
jgi:hypothetical protein